MTPEEAAARIAALKKILTQRLDNKSAANESNAICLRKSLLFSASAKSGVLSRQQFAHAFERLGAGFSPAVRAGGRARRAVRPASPQRALTRAAPPPSGCDQDLELLFDASATEGSADGHEEHVDVQAFVEAVTSREEWGPLRGSDFVTRISERHGDSPRVGKKTYHNSQPAAEPPFAVSRGPIPAPTRSPIKKTSNTPSLEGGIFAPAPPVRAPAVPSIKNSSTLSLGHAQWTPSDGGSQRPAFSAAAKKTSNTPSVPGGIFAPGSADDFRVKAELFVRPGY